MPASTYEELFDIETPLEESFKALLTAAAMDAFTRKNAFTSGDVDEQGLPIPAFQKIRPRVEIRAQLLGPSPQAHYHLLEPDETHIDMFRFAVVFQVVDECIAKPADNTAHPLHRARVRWTVSCPERKITTDTMPFHEIALRSFRPTGSELSIRDEQGCEFSMLRYEGDIFILPDAWPAVTP